MVMTASSGAVMWGANDRTTKGVVGRERRQRGRRVRGGGWVRRLGHRFALAVDRSPRCWRGVREACWGVRALPGERCDPLARGWGGSGAGRWCGGPELGGAAGGEGSLPLGTAGGGERVEGLLDAVGGLVALAEVADLGAGEPVGERASAAWMCSASGSPVVCPSAQAAERCA